MTADAIKLADATIAALAQVHRELESLVTSLGDGEMTRPSACSEWDLSQVLGHLGSGAELMLGTLERALTGAEQAFDPHPVWAHWNSMEPGDRSRAAVASDAKLVEAMTRLSASQREAVRIPLVFMPEPVDIATFAALRLNEATLHSWDIAVMADPGTALNQTATDILIDRAGVLVGRLAKGAPLATGQVEVSVETTEPPRSLGLTISETTALGPPPASPDAVLRTPAEALIRLTYGRLSPRRTPASVTLDSEVLTLDDLRQVFPGF